MGEPTLSRPARTLLALERRADRPWFLPSVAVFPMCDYALPFLPNQILLAGLSMTLPRRWIALAATFAIATAVGAALISTAIRALGPVVMDTMPGGKPEAGAIASIGARIRAHGLLALVGLAMLPWPPRTAVVACAIAGLPPFEIGLAVLVGRSVPATISAALGARSPRLLRRIPSVDRVAREVEGATRKSSACDRPCGDAADPDRKIAAASD